MLKHNLLIILRNIRHNKSSFFINLVGLSTGLICALLIFLWVNDELSVDKFSENERQLFQIMQNTQNENGIETMEATPGHLAEALAEAMPEVKYATTVIPTTFNISKGIISISDKNIRSQAQYVTKDFFNVFPYKMLSGNPDDVLSAKNKVVISDELAQKLFVNPENALGKTINWNAGDISGSYTVSGIFETPASNMTNHFDILLNYGLFEDVNPWRGWGDSSARTYVLLNKKISPSVFNQKIRDFMKSKDDNLNNTLLAQRYSDRYLHGYYENGKPAGGRIEYVRLFSLVAFFILIIACINFMNLSTAKAMGRIKEVGIKKTIGAAKKNLVAQYMTESMVMTFVSLGLALLAVRFLVVPFNGLTGKHLSLSFDLNQIIIILGTTVLTGFLAGSYPALYLSRFVPIDILKGKLKASAGEGRARKGLVVFQFAASVILIISVWVIFEQLSFIQSRNLGFNREHVIYFSTDKMSEEKLSEIRNIPGVVNAAGGNLKAGSPLGGTSGINWEGKNPDDNIFFSVKWVGYNLIETLDMQIADGKPFSEDFNSPDQIIFNEAAIKQMGLKNPVGQRVTVEGEERTIVGVVKDFNFESLYEKVKPCALFVAPVQYAPTISVRIKAGAEKATLKNLEKVYAELYPGQTFEYRYMDDDYQQLYSAEQRVSVISKYFAAIAILISCLGLLGMSFYTAERKTKEIGIRKVMGSSEIGIAKLLSGEFTKLVIIAIVVATP
ncbi:MAG: ABC transporter permease, partial [Bacteroidales bacterium]|nr:ABC transporter permease [Bacteroidales bacterium]